MICYKTMQSFFFVSKLIFVSIKPWKNIFTLVLGKNQDGMAPGKVLAEEHNIYS